jgi:hypothetical protein
MRPRLPGLTLAAGRIFQTLGVLSIVLGLVSLLFACSPANTADAPALLHGAWRAGAIGIAAVLLGTYLGRRGR